MVRRQIACRDGSQINCKKKGKEKRFQRQQSSINGKNFAHARATHERMKRNTDSSKKKFF